MITNLATKRLILAVATTKRDELDSPAVDAVEQGFGARVGVGGLARCVEDLVDGRGVVALIVLVGNQWVRGSEEGLWVGVGGGKAGGRKEGGV